MHGINTSGVFKFSVCGSGFVCYARLLLVGNLTVFLEMLLW